MSKRQIDRLLLAYISGEWFDQRYKTVWRQFTENALIHLARAASRVATDAKWFLEHPGKNPPLILKKHRGAPLKVERAVTLEFLVTAVNKRPAETDAYIAKLVAADHPEIKDRWYDATLRKMVGEAKRLAALREGTSVKHHVQGKFGHRPARKGRALGK